MFLVALAVVRIIVAAKGEERWDHLNSLCTCISGTGIKQGCRWCYSGRGEAEEEKPGPAKRTRSPSLDRALTAYNDEGTPSSSRSLKVPCGTSFDQESKKKKKKKKNLLREERLSGTKN
jgi:hypothetical protein